MNRPIRRLSLVVALLLFALLVNANVVQVLEADELRNRTGNTRLILNEYNRQRGSIVVGGSAIASSKETKDQLKYLRQYSAGPRYAAITGFYSHVFGATGIEKSENSILAGSDDRLFVRNLQNLFTDSAPKGGSIDLTINPRAQQAAMDGLAGRKGAAVAIDPSTGAILALASSPSYDPNLLSRHDGPAVTKAWRQLSADERKPLLDRALTETYPPGSTFKLVTSAAALESGRYKADSAVPGPARIPLPQSSRTLPNENGRPCGPGDKATLARALELSCNTSFASVGMSLGQDALREQARKFGFGSQPEVPMKAARSVFPDSLDKAQTALSSIGQFDVRATPLQMAMVVAGIANQGVVMNPYLVDTRRAPDLSILKKTDATELGRAMSQENATALTEMMVGVVDRGTGSNGRIDGVAVAGKTGTAQAGEGKQPHAWFVSFAPAVNPKVAVAVVVENGGGATEVSGNQIAAPIARAVMRAVLGS